MKLRILIFVLIILACSGIFYSWLKISTAPKMPESKDTKIFIVKKGEPIRSIAVRLEDDALIKNSVSFFLMVKLLRIEKQLQAGDFRLSPSMSVKEILEQLQHGSLDVWVTIPEGWRNEQIAQKLYLDLGIDRTEFLKYSQEGYMFPDTYLMPKNVSASAAATLIHDTFNIKVKDPLHDQITKNEFTLDEILTLASLIEREAKNEKDRSVVASILINRLKKGMALEIDATVQYAKANDIADTIYSNDWNNFDWWPQVTKEDLRRYKSPFNTYINSGLPPSPIANPGLASINAVLNPANTSYMFYISDPSGVNHYAENYTDHLANIQRYLQ